MDRFNGILILALEYKINDQTIHHMKIIININKSLHINDLKRTKRYDRNKLKRKRRKKTENIYNLVVPSVCFYNLFSLYLKTNLTFGKKKSMNDSCFIYKFNIQYFEEDYELFCKFFHFSSVSQLTTHKNCVLILLSHTFIQPIY